MENLLQSKFVTPKVAKEIIALDPKSECEDQVGIALKSRGMLCYIEFNCMTGWRFKQHIGFSANMVERFFEDSKDDFNELCVRLMQEHKLQLMQNVLRLTGTLVFDKDTNKYSLMVHVVEEINNDAKKEIRVDKSILKDIDTNIGLEELAFNTCSVYPETRKDSSKLEFALQVLAKERETMTKRVLFKVNDQILILRNQD